MEPAIQKEHLVENPRDFYGDPVPVDVVFCKVFQIIHACSLDILHDEDAFGCVENLWYIERRVHSRKVGDCPGSIVGFVHKVHFLWKVGSHFLLQKLNDWNQCRYAGTHG